MARQMLLKVWMQAIGSGEDGVVYCVMWAVIDLCQSDLLLWVAYVYNTIHLAAHRT